MALAIGVAAFCLVAILSLLPLGVTSVRESAEELASLSLSQKIIEDFKAARHQTNTPKYNLPLPQAGQPATNVELLLNEGGDVVTQPSDARYRFLIRVGSPAGGNFTARHVHLRAQWPAVATDPAAGKFVETVVAVP